MSPLSLRVCFDVRFVVGRGGDMGRFISENMGVLEQGGRSRVWQCLLCDLTGGEAVIALHINEQHVQK